MKMFLFAILVSVVGHLSVLPHSGAQSNHEFAFNDADTEALKVLSELAAEIRAGMDDYGNRQNAFQTQNVYYRTQLAFDSKVDVEVRFEEHRDIQFLPAKQGEKAKLVLSFLAAKSILRSSDSMQRSLYGSIWDELFEKQPTQIRRGNTILATSMHSTKMLNQAVLWKLEYSPGLNSSVVQDFQVQDL